MGSRETLIYSKKIRKEAKREIKYSKLNYEIR